MILIFSYDLTTDLLKVVVKQGSTIVINFQVIIILRSFDYPRMCLTGDPQWANSSCDCIFSDFQNRTFRVIFWCNLVCRCPK